MPLPTPFHPRTSALCTSYRWKDWAGFAAVCSYDYSHEREYFAFRHSAGLLDASPLYKYRIEGPAAGKFLSYVWARDIERLKVGQVAYGAWCDDGGKVVDDGTVARLQDCLYRMTSSEPALSWLARHSPGFDVAIHDESEQVAALALQGPTSRDILRQVAGEAVGSLGFFRATRAKIDGAEVEITRTGYTGDLGYEVWMSRERALSVWDAIAAAGRPYGLEPAGLDALDVSRVEAGFILGGVDYKGSRTCLTHDQKSSPFEIGLAWAVHLEREPFVGQNALQRERQTGSPWNLVGLEIDHVALERLYDDVGLPVQLPTAAWRTAVPVYDGLHQVGYATSGAWSPTLKKNLALCTVRARYAELGTNLAIEATVEYERRRIPAVVAARPFFDPERKKT